MTERELSPESAAAIAPARAGASGDSPREDGTSSAPRSPGTRHEQVLFEALVRQNAAALHLYLKACTRDAALAEEVFQDTLVVAWERLDDYDARRSFGAWTRGIASRVLKAKWRERATSQTHPTDVIERLQARFTALESHPGDTLDEKLRGLRSCLAELNERDRRAIEGRYANGLRGSALAVRLDTSLENSRKIVQRARARILHCMTARVS